MRRFVQAGAGVASVEVSAIYSFANMFSPQKIND
jgi:hypothetical protein